MKHIIATILVFLIIPFYANSQIGWQWAIGSTHPNTTGAFEAYCGTNDKKGNIIVIGAYLGDSAHIGPYLLNADSMGGGVVVMKLDSNGHYQWLKELHRTTLQSVNILTDTSGNIYFWGAYTGFAVAMDTFTLYNPQPGSQPICMVKLSPAGDVLWMKNVGYNLDVSSCHMALNRYGQLYMYGSFFTPMCFIDRDTLSDTGTGERFFLAEYDDRGNFKWAHRFHDYNYSIAGDIIASPGGSLYISGACIADSLTIGTKTIFSRLHNSGFGFLAKLDTSGKALWAKNVSELIGSPGYPTMDALKLDRNENIYASGGVDGSDSTKVLFGRDTLVSYVSFSPLFGKFDSSGNAKWSKCFQGLRSGGLYNAVMLYNYDIDILGNIWMTGGFRNPITDPTICFDSAVLTISKTKEPAYFANYDTAGHYVQSFAITGGGDDADNIILDNKGCFYFVGDYVSDSMGYLPPYLDSQLILGRDTFPQFVGIEALVIAKYRYLPSSSFPNSVSPIATNADTDITLYPNPAKQSCTIAISSSEPVQNSTLTISDVQGRLIGQYTLATQTTVPLNGLSPGLYICKITLDNGSIVVKKLAVE